MIATHYRQRTLAEGLFAEEIDGWWEPWMKKADAVLEEEELIDLV